MAEEEKSGAAQNKFGELFVQLGFKGLPNMLKGLNAVSAQFLLAKNAAQQAIKPFMEMSQNAVGQIANYDKLHSVMGTAVKDLQDYKIAAQLIGVSPDLLFSQMKNVQQQILRIRAGLDSNGLKGFARLDIDPRSLDINDPLGIIMQVGERLKTVDNATRTTALGLLNWSDELAYLFDRAATALDSQNTKFTETLKLNDEELNSLREQQDAWNLLSTTWAQAQQKFIANQGWINKQLEETSYLIQDITNRFFKKWEYGSERGSYYRFLAKIGQGIGDIKVNYLRKEGINVEDQLLTAYNNGDKHVIERYNELKKKNDAHLEKSKQAFLQDERTTETLKNLSPQELTKYKELAAKNPILNQIQAPSDEEKKKEALGITPEELKAKIGATPLNEEAKSAGLPPLPQAAPSKPTQFLPSNTTREVQYTVIPEVVVNQYIQGENPQEIAYESGREFDKAILTSLYNQNSPNN